MTQTVFKLVDRTSWQAAERSGAFAGSPADVRDGFIHFSTAAQVPETATRHFAGQSDLVLVAVAVGRPGDAPRGGPPRGGAPFSHLYAPLPLRAGLWGAALPPPAPGPP